MRRRVGASNLYRVSLGPGNRAAEMLYQAFLEKYGLTEQSTEKPKIDPPVDEIGTYRELPRRVIPFRASVRPKPFWQRIRDKWFT